MDVGNLISGSSANPGIEPRYFALKTDSLLSEPPYVCHVLSHSKIPQYFMRSAPGLLHSFDRHRLNVDFPSDTSGKNSAYHRQEA